MKTKGQFSKTDRELFRTLRSLRDDKPEWFSLRNQIWEENVGLAYYAVNMAGSRLLNKFTGGMRDNILHDLRHLALTELLRVITAYDPERPHPHDEDKYIEFATFAYKNLLLKIRDECKKITERLELDESLTESEPDDQTVAKSEILVAKPSSEAMEQLEEETRIDYFTRIGDPSITPRLASILNKLKHGDNVTLFERQFLFKLIADPHVVLTRREHAGSEAFNVSQTHEPTPLRRYRSWRQILG